MSIFNFNKITKIIIIFLFLFISYNIFLLICNPKVTRFQNQWQTNYSIAQDFIYGEKTTNIIVGSSLSTRLNKNILPSSYYNLAFSGGSVLTGLELIKRTGYIPKYIFIESNFIFRAKSTTMINDLFYPIWWRIKNYIPSLKEKFQLLNVIYAKSICSKKEHQKKTKAMYSQKPKNLKKIKLSKKFKIMIKQQTKNLRKPLKYKSKLQDIKKLISYFEMKGSKLIFFEMPIENSLAFSPKLKLTRKILKKTFKNKWLPLPIHTNYYTRDGLHLVNYSAWIYTKKFLENINKTLTRSIKN